MKPFFSYYGSKWRSIPLYPSPRHETIVEPFAGSASYSVRNARHRVILVDSDPVICGVWDYLIRASPDDILRLPDVETSTDELEVGQEARWLIGFWLNRGVQRPQKRPSRWMRDGIRPGSFWGERVRHTIASQVKAIRHWKVCNGSYEDCPVVGPATWFVDPPYRVAGRHYVHGSKGIDFRALGEWCRNLPGQTIVCEAEGADWLPFRFMADVKSTRRGTRSREAIWTSADATDQLSLF